MPRDPRKTPDDYVPGQASPPGPGPVGRAVKERLAEDIAEAQKGDEEPDEDFGRT